MSDTSTIELDLPVYWASYIINNDGSGLTPAEVAACDAALAREGVTADDCLGVGEEDFFDDFDGLGTDLATYTFRTSF